jgi:hypothetical protein
VAVTAAAHRTAVTGLALVALSVGVYAPSFEHDWLNYDDDVYVTANRDLQRGLTPEGLAWAFSTFQGANWFPLTRVSWMLDRAIWGLDAGGFHATSVGLHALNALLLFLALAKLTARTGRSAFVAAVFAVHPLHVESVAWIAARKDLVSGLFFMLALLAYARAGPDGPGLRRQVLVFVCAALGLMAKPVVVTLPFVLLLLDEWPLGRLRRRDAPDRWDPVRVRRAVREKLPLFALAAAASAVTVVAQRAGGSVASLEQMPLHLRAANAVVAYTAYLGKALWPSGLAVFYPHPGAGIGVGRVALAAALLAAITGLVLATARRRPYGLVGWLWYLGMLVPVIGLVQVGSQSMADRYTYLPLIGVSILVAWGVPDLLGGGRGRGRALAAAAGVAIAALAAGSALQLRHWRDSETLFTRALSVTRDNHVAHAYLGRALLAEGRAREAIEHYSEAVRLRPEFLTAANNLAWLLATAEAESLRNPYAALRLAQRSARLTRHLDPPVLDTLAAAYAASGRFEEAVAAAERGVALAREAGDRELADQIAQRLALYRQGEAYRENPTAGAGPGTPSGGGPAPARG